MPDDRPDSTELWYRASARNVTIFALIWLGEALLILMLVKWAIHGSAAVYLLIIPWALIGLILVLRPGWIVRMDQAFWKVLERIGEPWEKRPPPGFP